jgi:hypothetical protein
MRHAIKEMDTISVVNRDELVYIIALVVAGVWAIVSLVSLFLKDYTGLTIVTPVMVIVAGFLFGFKKNGNGGS